MREYSKLSDFYIDNNDNNNIIAKDKYRLAMQKTNVCRQYSYKPRLCVGEKIQLMHDYDMLEVFLSATNTNKHQLYPIPKRKYSKQIKFNFNTLTYLLYLQDILKGMISRLRKLTVKAAVEKGCLKDDFVLCMHAVSDEQQ